MYVLAMRPTPYIPRVAYCGSAQIGLEMNTGY